MSDFDLKKEDLDIKALAEDTISNEDLLDSLLAGLLSKDDKIRYNSFEVLLQVSKDHPEFLYVRWDYFQNLLSRSNNYSKYIAVYIIAHLTAVDKDEKFESIFDDYFGLLGGTRTMISSHVALNSAVVAINKPELQPRIVDILLEVDNIHQGRQVELIKAYIIQALQKIYSESDDKKRIEEFVNDNLESKSPKTRDAAKSFMEIIES